MPISTKLALLKKKRMQMLSQEDEEKYAKHMQTLTPNFMMLAPRALTGKEAQKQQKTFDDANTKFIVNSNQALFTDRKQIAELQQELKGKLEDVFKDRVDLKEQRYNEVVKGMPAKKEESA